MKNSFRFLFVVFCLFISTNPLFTQWIQTNGPSAGNVNSLVVSGTNLFAGAQGGVYLSSNNGTSWTPVNMGPFVLSLAVSGTYIFAGTQSGVLRSTNNGTSWTSTSMMYPYVNALAVSGTNLFAGTGGFGVFLSTDNGTSWTAVNTGLTNPNVLSLAVSGTNLFAGARGGGVFLSTNNGTSWSAVGTGGLTYTDVCALAVSGTSVFAGTVGGGVFFSTNNGTSWTAVNAGLTNLNVLSLAVLGANLFAGTQGSGVFLSINNGTSWTAASTGLTFNYVYALAVGGTNLFAGTGGGVSRRPLSEMITSSQPLIGIWDKAFGPGDPIRYNFLTTSTVLVVHNATWTDTTDYTTFAIPSSSLRGIDLGQGGVVGWRGVYRISSDSSSFQLEGYWYTGLPPASTPTSFTLPTTYAKVATAQIPNSGFEDWTTQSGIEIPSGPWVTGNLLSKPVGVTYNPVTKSSDHYPANVGSYSIRMENNISFVGEPGGSTRYWPCAYGFSVTAFYPGYVGPVFPIAGHPASLSGYYKFIPQNRDTMSIGIALYKNGTLVAGATFMNTKLVSDWTSFSIAIPNYSSADSAQIGLSAFYAPLGKYPTGPYGNSILYVDNLSFDTSVPLSSVPTITSFSPTSGPIGTKVTITGTNFSTTPANNIVYFGAVRETVTSATSTSLIVSVSACATYQPITVTVGGLTGYSSQPFIVTFPTVASVTSGSFASKVDFATGIYPFGLAIGDIDGDGKPDMVISNSNNMIGTTVSVFRNTGSSDSITSGTFASKLDFATGLSPRGVAIGDIDGDGKPDLVVGNYQSNSVSILRNTSTSGSITSGTFAANVDFATGPAPDYVAIGDIDGDGRPDLITTNLSGNNVSVLRNTSASGSITSGSFAANVDFATGTIPYAVAVGDIDGDGKPDLVVANFSSNTVSVLRNTSTSGIVSFAQKVDFATGTAPYSVAIGDLDGDGKPDLVVVNQNSNTVSVLKNTSSSASISFAAKIDFATGSIPSNVAIGDIDGDGKPDLVLVNSSSKTVSVFRNTGSSGSITSGSFAAKIDFATGANPLGVAIGDIDGDGKPDLVVGNLGSNTVSVLRNTIAGAMAPPIITSFTPSSGPIGTAVTIKGSNFSASATNNIVFFGATKATLTGASTTQLTVTVPAGATYQPITVTVGGLTVYSSQPFIVTFPTVASITSGSFAPKVDFATAAGPMRVAIGDIDGDGKADLVVANGGTNTISVFRNTNSSGSITSGSFAAPVDLAAGILPVVVAIGDLDGDGKPDLVVTNRNSNTVSVFRNTSSSNSMTLAARADFATGVQPYCVAIGDLDGDGKPDLAVGNIDGTVSIFRNTGTTGSITSGSFAAKVDLVDAANIDGVAIGDIDGDGKPDLVVVSCNYNIVSVLRNTSSSGSIAFATKVDLATGTEPHGVAIGDLDGDGKPDLVVGNYRSKTVSVFRNTGSPGSITFVANVYTTAPSPLSVAIGDIDGDGKPDLVVSGTDSAAVSVLRNTSTSGSITPISFAAKVDFGTGVTPYYIATGDIDGDGKSDLIAVNLSSNTISVLRNVTQSPQTQATLASIGPLSASKGTDFSIEIRVGDSTHAASVFGVGFDLLYTNTSFIDFVSADISGSFLGGDLLYLMTPDDANGKASIGLSRKAPLSGVSGGGTLIRLKFHVALTAPDNGTATFSFANVSVNDQNGKSITLLPVSGTTTIQGFSVWPGDADNSGTVNQSDILPLGLYWGSTGPARSNASLQWIAQSATAWTPQAATYADANGDGVVNQADVLAIGLNWGKTHSLGKMGSSIANGQTPTQASVQGTPVLRATGPATVRGKTTFDVTVTLGDTVNPVSGLFGISFVLDFAGSKSIIQATEVTAGTLLGSDIIFFPQIDNNNGLVAFGMTRKSGASGVAGFGQVANIKFQVANNTSNSSLVFTTRDITANDANGNAVDIQPSSSSILASINDINSVPVGFRLEQNYPNPFNPSTRISYSVPKTTRVRLSVLDALGREVSLLVNGERTAGIYEMQWEAGNFPSGIYFYRLQAGDASTSSARGFVATKKMILLK